MNLGSIFSGSKYSNFDWGLEASWSVEREIALDEAKARYESGQPLVIVGIQYRMAQGGDRYLIGLAWRAEGEKSIGIDSIWEQSLGSTTTAFLGQGGRNTYRFFVPGKGFGSYLRSTPDSNLDADRPFFG